MAIGAHELLLIVRAQNQASGLLGRISRDFRRLQAMRDLEMQKAQQLNRLARNQMQQRALQAKLDSSMLVTGKARLQQELAKNRIYAQAENLEHRIEAIEIRRAAVRRAESNIQVQRLRMQKQELAIETRLAEVDARRVALNNQLNAIGVQMMRNQLSRQSMTVGATASESGSRALGLQAQLMERELAQRKAISALAKKTAESRGEGSVVGSPAYVRKQVADLRVAQTKAAMAEMAGSVKILEASMQGLQGKIKENQLAFDRLGAREAELNKETAILNERQVGLQHALDGVAARGKAAAAAEEELRTALALNAQQLLTNAAAWDEHIKQLREVQIQAGILGEEEKMLGATVMETNAAIAAQRPEELATAARAVSHIGRVLQLTGLVGVAAFGAMGVAAAHFNTEAVRAATQTGNINASADQVVANSKKIQDAVTAEMMSIPASSHDLTNSLYYIYSTMNTTLGQGTKLLKVFSDAWVAGGMVGNVEDVSTALVTLANNWGITANQMGAFRKLANSTLATVRFGGLTLEQYTQTMNQLAPAFHGANQSVEQMNASIAFLTRLLPSSHVAAAGIARMMQQLQRLAAHPAAGFEGLAKAIQTPEGNLKPLDQVLKIIIRMHPEIVKSGVALQNFWRDATGNTGTIQAQRAFQAFIKSNQLYQTIVKQTTGDQKELNRALAAFQQTAGFKWQLFITQMHAFALELGTVVLPYLIKAIQPLQDLAKWFGNLSKEQQQTIGKWAAFIAIGTLVLGVIMSIGGALAATIIGFRTMKTTLGPLLGLTEKNASAFKLLRGESGFLSARVMILLGKIGLLIIAFQLIQGQTHSFARTMQYLFNIFAAFTLIKMISGLGLLSGALLTTAGATTVLEGAVLGLQAASLLEITAIVLISYELSKLIDKIPFVNSLMGKLGDTLYKISHPDRGTFDVTLKNLDQIRQKARDAAKPQGKPWWEIAVPRPLQPAVDAVRKITGGPLILNLDKDVWRKDIADIQKDVKNLLPRPGTLDIPLPAAVIAKRLANAYPELDPHAILVLVNHALATLKRATTTSQWTNALRQANFGAVPITPSTPKLSGTNLIADARRAAALNKALTDAGTQPDPRKYIKAWNDYNNYVNKVTANLTKPQKKLWDDLLNFMENLPAPTRPLSVIISMDKAVNKLHQAALKSQGDIKLWNKYWAALDQLKKIATPDQLSKADELIGSLTDVSGLTRATQKMIDMALAIDKLQAAAEKSPRTVALWDALDKAQKAFAKTGTPDQQANANEIASAIMNQGQAAQYSTPYILQLAIQVERLNKAAAADPTNLAKSVAAIKAAADLQKKGTPDQISAATPVAQAIVNKQVTVPQATITRLTLQRNALQKIAETAPKAAAVAAWNKYFAVVDKLDKLATGHQQEIADSIAAIAGAGHIGLQEAIRLQHQIINLQKIAAKAPTTANWQRYFAAVKNLANNASQDIQDQSAQIAQAQADAQAAAIQSQQDANDKAAQAAQQAYDTWRQKVIDGIDKAQQDIKSATSTLLSFYQNALQQYQSELGTLFQGPFMQSAVMQNRQQFGFSARPQDLIKDMREAVGHAEHFNSVLDKLRKRGAPEALVGQIAQLGPEAQKQLDTLMKMTPNQFQEYVKLFNKGQEDAKRYAKKEMDRQVKEWLKFGKSVALAIMTGIKSETPGMEDAITNMVKKIFPGLAATAAQTPPPEKTFVGATASGATATTRVRVGGMSGLGPHNTPQLYDAGGHRVTHLPGFTDTGAWKPTLAQAIANDKAWKAQQRSMAPSLQRRTQSAYTGNVTNHNVTYNIHPTHQGEGVESMLRRSHFYYRNRKTNM